MLWFRRVNEIMCNEVYYVMYPLLNLGPMNGFKCGSNVGMFRDAGDSAGKCIFECVEGV